MNRRAMESYAEGLRRLPAIAERGAAAFKRQAEATQRVVDAMRRMREAATR